MSGALNMTHAGHWLLGLGDPSTNGDVDCSVVHSVNASMECQFVNATDSCHITEGIIDYTIFVYCEFQAQLVPLAITILFIWLLFLFVALAITADNFFCPSLEVMAKTMHMSDNIAMLLAFGNGAPDVFSAISAVANMKNGNVGLVFGALLGAGVFLTTVVAGAVCLVGSFHLMERPFLRDLIFYLITVCATFIFCWDGYISLLESLFYMLAYVVYVVVVVAGRIINKWPTRRAPVLAATPVAADLQAEGRGVAREPGVGVGERQENGGLLDSTASEGEEEPLSNGINGHRVVRPAADELHDPGEDTPLLPRYGAQHVRVRGVVLSFLIAASPIDVDEWRTAGRLARAYNVFKAPALLVIKLTTPVVDYSCAEQNWNKPLQIIQCVITPVFVIFAADTGVALLKLGGVFYVWLFFLIFGCVLAIVVAFTSTLDQAPVYHPVFAYAGFFAAVMWIKMIANEIVNILQTGGAVFNVSNAVLGLTFLAWGNSIGDFISDVAMARRGFPRTGISACFGGPLFNTLLGIGIPFTIKTISDGEPVAIDFSSIQLVLFCGVGASLVFSLILVPILRFNVNRVYGIILILIYVVFLLLAVLVESDIIKFAVR